MSEDNVASQKAIVMEWSSRAGRPDRWEHFHPDFKWRMIGSTPVSGTMSGVTGIDRNIAEFRAWLSRLEVTVDALICDDDMVVKLAHSDGLTVDAQAPAGGYSPGDRSGGCSSASSPLSRVRRSCGRSPSAWHTWPSARQT